MIYAMSDIHGCIEELQKQMEQVDLSGKNRIIFLGDYIDYGDSSCQVLEYIRDLQKEYGEEKVVVLKGNHEQMFLEWIDDRNYHDVFYDGESHYYIDGSVYKGGKLLLLAYDEENGKYYQVENSKMIPVRPFDKYQ